MKFFKTRIGAFLGGVIVLAFLVFVLILVFELSYVGNFYPGVVFAGQDLGGMNYQAVEERISLAVEKLQNAGINLTVSTGAANYFVTVPRYIAGLTPDTVVSYFDIGDWQSELADAYQIGRSGSILTRARAQLSAMILHRDFQVPYSVYEASLKGFLSRELDNILSKESPANYVYRSGYWQINPESVGESVDLDMIVAKVKQVIKEAGNNNILVEAKVAKPATNKIALEPYLDFVANSLANTELRFKYNGYVAYLSGWSMINWLKIDPNRQGDFKLKVDSDKFRAFLRNKVGGYLENPMKNSRFEVRGGELVEISPGVSGSAIDFDALEMALDRFLTQQYADYTVPVVGEEPTYVKVFSVQVKKEEPKVTQETIDQYGIKDLVASARTSFSGSGSARVHNISLAASKLNGILLAPGEEFSAVNGIGYVTEEAGYEKEYVIKGNESVKEIGGGLCQLATTLFRMALDGGLPITERVNHSYVVGYYGPGLDATIYGPHPDFRFVNDTGHYLLLQGRTEGTDLVFELYGQKDGRIADISEPEIYDRIPPPEPKYIPSTDLALGAIQCTEHARYGLTAKATYTVTYPDGETREQIFKSVYRPWQKVCLIGTRAY